MPAMSSWPALRVLRLVNPAERQRERDGSEQHMDEKHPFPAQHRDDRAADERTKSETDAEDDAPPAKSARALLATLEFIGKHGDLTDQHRTAACALQEPRDDQRHHVLGKTAYQ